MEPNSLDRMNSTDIIAAQMASEMASERPCRAWDIHLNGEIIDTVWFEANMSQPDVEYQLIDHDNYPPFIVARPRQVR